MKTSTHAHAKPSIIPTYSADFETTISPFKTERDLRAVLNFAALFHEVVFLNDTAIGDNTHILASWQRGTDSGLYHLVSEFTKEGIVKYLFRNKVVIGERILVEKEPTLSDIYRGWQLRGPKEAFTHPDVGLLRDRFNSQIDDLLFRRVKNAVVWYDPDKVKPEFRQRLRQLIDSRSPVREILDQLPSELRRRYLQVCENNPFFTNADLWTLIKDEAIARELVLVQGHINQQCYADYVYSGMSGADNTSTSMAELNWRINTGASVTVELTPPPTVDELFEQARFVLPAPVPELLGKLAPDAIVSLRERAEKTIFKVAREGLADANIDDYKRKYIDSLVEYWNYIMNFLEEEYPQETRRKTRLGFFVEQQLPNVAELYRTARLPVIILTLRHLIPSVLGEPLSTITAIGLGQRANQIIKKLEVHLVYEETQEMKQAREILPPDLWLRGLWATNKWSWG